MNFIAVLFIVLNFTYILCNSSEFDNIDNDAKYQDGVVRVSDELTSIEGTDEPNGDNELESYDRTNKESDDFMQADKSLLESNNEEVTTGTPVNSVFAELTTSESTIDTTKLTTDTTITTLAIISETTSLPGDSYTTESLTTEVTTESYSTEAVNTEDTENFVDDNDTTTETTVETTKASENNEKSHEEVQITEKKKSGYVNKLSDQIKTVLAKYKESGNVIISDVPIPDPLPIPDMDKRVSMVNMNFKNQTVYGLSNFTVQHINTDLEKMQVYIMLHIKKLVILGNYSMRSFLSRASGPFNVTLLDVITEGAAALHYTPEGTLEASETDMDMTFRDMKLDFKNLGFMGAFFQGVIGAVGSFIFEGIKPAILTEVNTNVRKDINAKIKTMSSGIKTNASMSPVDQAVVEGRRYIKSQGYDPYHLANYTKNMGIVLVNITEFSVRGLSRFYKVGEVSLSMDNGTVEFGIHLATDKLSGSCQWSVGVSQTPLRQGISMFTVDHLQVRAIIRQSLNLTEHPKLHDLDFLLGKINLKTRREDTIDFMVEWVVNNLPSLLRHIIVDGLEEPIKERAQRLLNEVDIETIVDEQLPNLDKFGV